MQKYNAFGKKQNIIFNIESCHFKQQLSFYNHVTTGTENGPDVNSNNG